jgi:hypothetical protein
VATRKHDVDLAGGHVLCPTWRHLLLEPALRGRPGEGVVLVGQLHAALSGDRTQVGQGEHRVRIALRRAGVVAGMTRRELLGRGVHGNRRQGRGAPEEVLDQ